jgi:hypothetical protein
MREPKASARSVVLVIGAGSIGQAIARQLDVSSRESIHELVEAATPLGDVTSLIHAAGVSPSQASPATILAVDLYGTAVVLEEFGNIIARACEARELAACNGRGGDVGQARRLRQHNQSRNHHQVARQGRIDRATRRRIPANDRAMPSRPRRYAGRGRQRRSAPLGRGRRLHHRKRLPDGWRSHRFLLVRRSRPEVTHQSAGESNRERGELRSACLASSCKYGGQGNS